MDPLLSKIAEHGVVGVFAAVFLFLYIQKDKALSAEVAARIADSKTMLQLALGMQDKSNDSIGKLAAIFEELRRRTVK